MKPIIGITAGEVYNRDEPWAPITYGQMHHYVDAVIRAGGVPIILPISDDISVADQLYEQCDGILFSGGNDIHPRHYGQSPGPYVVDVSERRDIHELYLMGRALSDDKPLLAICRGMQLLNVIQGGSLYQDIASELPDRQDHQSSRHAQDINHIAHRLRIEPDSRLSRVLETHAIAANLRHHQAVRDLGNDLHVVARAEDGVVEAIEIPRATFVLGVQPHPEAIESFIEPRWQKLFSAFVVATR